MSFLVAPFLARVLLSKSQVLFRLEAKQDNSFDFLILYYIRFFYKQKKMNSLIRATARCLRPGSAVYLTRQADTRMCLTPGQRFLCSATGIKKDLAEIVKKDKVVVFMKGDPSQPMCGFSNAVVQILRMHGVDDYASYNVLEDQDLRQGQSAVHYNYCPLQRSLASDQTSGLSEEGVYLVIGCVVRQCCHVAVCLPF